MKAPTTDPQADLGHELDRRADRRDAWYGLKGYVHQNGPLLGFDAGEGTKHDPSSGQFTSGGGSSGGKNSMKGRNPAREGEIAAGAKGGTPGERGQIAARNEGGSSGPPSHNEAHRKANYHEAQARSYKSKAEEASSPADKKRAAEMAAHHETQGKAMRQKGEADGPTQKKPATPQVERPEQGGDPKDKHTPAQREAGRKAAAQHFSKGASAAENTFLKKGEPLPGMAPGRAEAIKGGAQPNAREVSQKQNQGANFRTIAKQHAEAATRGTKNHTEAGAAIARRGGGLLGEHMLDHHAKANNLSEGERAELHKSYKATRAGLEAPGRTKLFS